MFLSKIIFKNYVFNQIWQPMEIDQNSVNLDVK